MSGKGEAKKAAKMAKNAGKASNGQEALRGRTSGNGVGIEEIGILIRMLGTNCCSVVYVALRWGDSQSVSSMMQV